MTETVEVPAEVVREAAKLIASEIARSRLRPGRTVRADAVAREVLTAAAPLLRAQWERELREQIADEIEAERSESDEWDYAMGLLKGAAIVRGGGAS